MRAVRAAAIAGALAATLMLSGCFLMVTSRRLPIPKAPNVLQTAEPATLVAQLNQRWAAVDTLTATVEIQASIMKSKEGLARDITSFRGHILIRKPESLRVVGQVPYLGSRMFDMASNGKNFTLFIPSKNKVVTGPNELKKRSANQMENLRPGFFMDSIVVRGLEPDDFYSVTSDTSIQEDAQRKHVYSVPEYILNITRRKSGSQEMTTVRVITFHRDDLLPYQQDLYDKDGNLETQVFYADYADFGGSTYPSKVTIRRPREEYQIVLTVDKVMEHMALTDDQFQVKIPEGTPVQQLQ